MPFKIPQNQLDALPLVDADSVGDPGELQIIGNTMTRFWSGAASGINNIVRIADPDEPATSMLLSNYLDVRGCSKIQLVVTRRVDTSGGGTDEDNITLSILVQYQNAAGVNQRTGGGAGLGTTYAAQLGTITYRSALTAGLALPVTFVMTRGLAMANDNPATPNAPIVMVGFRVRVWLRWTVGLNAAQFFTLEIWGAQ